MCREVKHVKMSNSSVHLAYVEASTPVSVCKLARKGVVCETFGLAVIRDFYGENNSRHLSLRAELFTLVYVLGRV